MNINKIIVVPGDGSCQLWSVAMAYLLPEIKRNEHFHNRFIKLFGYKHCNYVQELLTENTSSSDIKYSGCYEDSTFKNLVSEKLRTKVIDTMRLPKVKGKFLETITLQDFSDSHNKNFITSGKILIEMKKQFTNITFDVYDFNQTKSEEVIEKVAEMLNAVDSGARKEFLYYMYLKCMEENTSSWGGHHELLAISYILRCEIQVNDQKPIKWFLDNECKIHLSYDGSHYNFYLDTENITRAVMESCSCSYEQEVVDISREMSPLIKNKEVLDDKKVNKQQCISPNISKPVKPSKTDDKKDNAAGSDSLFSGPDYQVKLLFLFLHRALTSQYNFELATEWKEAEKFDDVVFMLKDVNGMKNGLFLQAKHKVNENKKITYEELLNVGNGEFSLKKYFISYMKMKENTKLSNVQINSLVIFTNIDFDQKTVKSKNMLNKIEMADSVLHFESKFKNKIPICYLLIPDYKIKNILKNCSQVVQLAEELVNHVFCDPPKQLTLKTPIFKDFHQALCTHVIDKVSNKFQKDFIKGENLSAPVQKFRSIFYEFISLHKNKKYECSAINIILREDFVKQDESGYSSSELPDDVISEKDINCFFERLVFAVDQPNENDLGKVIEQEVSSFLNLSHSKDIVEQVVHDLVDWSKQKKGEFITQESGKTMFDNAKNIMNNRIGIGLCAKYKTKLKMHSKVIQFNEVQLHTVKEILNNDKEYVIRSNEPLLTMIKICQCISEHIVYKADDSHIFIELGSLLESNQQNLFLRAFNTNLLLVIYCNCTIIKLNEKILAVQSLFNKFFEKLNKKIKKLLVVVHNKIQMQKNMTNRFRLESDETNFNDLSSDSQTALLDKPVKFQSNLIKLGELNKNRCDWNEILDGKTIAELISNGVLEIGSAPLKLSQLEAAFAKKYKEIEPNNLLKALKLDSHEPKTEIFLITETTKPSNARNQFERFCQLFEIDNAVPKFQLANCMLKFDSNSDIDYTACKKINVVLNEKDEKNLDIFKKICYYNSEKFVYWLEIVNDKFHWLQVYDPHFYIQRHFITQKVNKKENLSHLISNNKCVIILKNKASERLYQWISEILNSRKEMQSESEITKKQNVFVCETQSEAEEKLDELRETYDPSSIHLLKARDETSDNLLIKESDYIDCQLVSEEELANGGERVVLIVAEPGMGKTTTLTRLSQYKLKDNWVIRLNLRNHQDQIKNYVDDPHKSLVSVSEFLLSVSHDNNVNRLTTKLLQHSLIHETSKPFLILFDGYDEISDECKTKLMTLIKYLKENTLAKIYISSRKEHSKDLEKKLGVLSTTFKELFNEIVVYLKNFYQIRLKLQLSENDREMVFERERGKFNLFFEALFDKMDKVFLETIFKFVGVPLQLRLLAEGFLPEFEQFVVKSTQEKCPDINNLNVINFYQRFINVKYDIYFQEKTRLTVGLSNESKRWLSDELNRMHQRVALQLLFPKIIKWALTGIIKPPFNNENFDMTLELEKELLRVGILHVDPFEGMLEFIHQTFAEYFIAEFILNNLRKPLHPQIFQATYNSLMYIITENYTVVCMFLNEKITKEDLSLVKFGNIDTRTFDTLENISKDYKNLTEFILTFIKNKVWILKQLDFYYILRENLELWNESYVESLVKLTINHYDVVHKYLLHKPDKNSEQFLWNAALNEKKIKVSIIMSAIKCYPKLIEEVTRDYYLEDLCELFKDDEELCQLINKLKDNDSDGNEMTSYELKVNNLLKSFADENKTIEAENKTFRSFDYFNKYRYGVGHKPYKITKGRDLENLVFEIEKLAMSKTFAGLMSESYLKPYEKLNQKLKSIKCESNKSNLEEQMYDNEVGVLSIMRCAIESVINSEYAEAKDTLQSLTHLPIADLWFNTLYYNNNFKAHLKLTTKIKQEALLLFLLDWSKSDPILSMHLFRIVFSNYPKNTQKVIDSVECEEMKTLLSDLSLTPETNLCDYEIKKFARDLLSAIENGNYKEIREVISSVERNSDDTMRWIMEESPTPETELYSKKILINVLEFLAEHGEAILFKVIEDKKFLFLKQMMNCMMHFPRILHLLILTYFKHNDFAYFCNRQFFLLNLVHKKVPKIFCCLVISVYCNACTPLSYALENNDINNIRLLFNILLPHPTILKRLILTSSRENKTYLHFAILKCKTKTLEVFLSQLNRNMEVIKYVIDRFVSNEEDKLNLYEAAVKNDKLDSLLIFLNSLSVNDRLFANFFLPADKNIKPAFYLAGERGCKEVMDVLLRALKSERKVLWQLLMWTDAASGKTVLHRAAERGYREIVDAILTSVRKLKHELNTLFFITDKLSHTPLDCAILSERQIVRNNFNIEFRRKLIVSDDYRVLHKNFGNGNSIQCLLNLSIDLKNIPMVVNLILIYAKSFNFVELMTAMFENEELKLTLEDMNVTKEDYSYNLYYSAIERDSLELVNELIKKGYDVNCTNGYGYTPLMKAVERHKSDEIIISLLKGGADIYFNNMNGESSYSMAWDPLNKNLNFIDYILIKN